MEGSSESSLSCKEFRVKKRKSAKVHAAYVVLMEYANDVFQCYGCKVHYNMAMKYATEGYYWYEIEMHGEEQALHLIREAYKMIQRAEAKGNQRSKDHACYIEQEPRKGWQCDRYNQLLEQYQ